MTHKSGVKIFFAGVLGAFAGAIGGLLFAPQSGKATREDIARVAKEIEKSIRMGARETENRTKAVFGKVSKEAVKRYEKVKGMVVDKLVALKSAGSVIDKEKYEKIVDEVVTEFKNDAKVSRKGVIRLKGQLKKDWEKVKKALKA